MLSIYLHTAVSALTSWSWLHSYESA